jgi:hypothetical protein
MIDCIKCGQPLHFTSHVTTKSFRNVMFLPAGFAASLIANATIVTDNKRYVTYPAQNSFCLGDRVLQQYHFGYTMPKFYTLTPRPIDLSAGATLIHRLRHPLRAQRICDIFLPPHASPSARTDSDIRRQRIEDKWLEVPTRSGSPYRLLDVENKGEYSQHRYGDVDLYWNSVMVEAGEDRKMKQSLKEKRRRRKGRSFDDTEQLYQAFARNHIEDLHKQPHHDSNSDRYITLTEKTSVAELDAHEALSRRLTWNLALESILASSHIDPEVAALIRSRARGRRTHRYADTLDMIEVSMVPNFSYPIADSRWCSSSDANDIPPEDRGEHSDENPGLQDDEQRAIRSRSSTCNHITNDAHPACSPSYSSDSLYRPRTPPPRH